MQFSGLRPHQVKAVQMLRAGWKQHDTHLMNMPCGAGKTALASYLAEAFSSVGKKVVFAAPYITLVNQTYERFEQYGHTDLSVIWRRDARYRKNCRVQIASADTLIRRDFPEDAEILIWDEAHLKREKLIEIVKTKPGLKTIGLTATPFAKWMGGVYQNFIKPVTSRELVDLGMLTPFDIVSPEPPPLEKGLKLKANEFGEMDIPADYAAKVMGDAKIVGDVLDNWVKNGDNLPTIAFAPNVSTANAYCLAFQRAGIASEVVTADTEMQERGPMFYRFETGRTKVLWNVGVLGAGFDADVRCIIWAKMTKSETVWMQGTMRGSRPAPGKTECKLFDHAGTYWAIGSDPIDIEHYTLHDGTTEETERRTNKKEKAAKEAKSKVCPACGHVKAPGEFICSKCGHKPLYGEITVDVDESRELVSVKGTKKKQMSQEQKADFYRQLIGYQHQRAAEGKPVSDGYIAHTYRDKTGVWPKGMPRDPLPPGPEVISYIQHKNIKFAKSRAKT